MIKEPEKLGGMYNGLKVLKRTECFQFTNCEYGMRCTIYFEDIDEYLSNPYKKHWGDRSSSNDLYDTDRDEIIEYLKRSRCRYKSVTDVMKSKSKFKKKYLKQFSVKELLEYYKTKKGKSYEITSS